MAKLKSSHLSKKKSEWGCCLHNRAKTLLLFFYLALCYHRGHSDQLHSVLEKEEGERERESKNTRIAYVVTRKQSLRDLKGAEGEVEGE